MTILELITRKVSVQTMIAEEIIDKVINHQWKSVKKALKTNNSVEITGLGTFLVRPYKLLKEIEKNKTMIEKLEEKLKSDHSYKSLTEERLAECKVSLELLLNKQMQLENEV